VALVGKKTWIVYAKPPFAGLAAVLAYLSRYTHRVAISNRRLIAVDDTGVTFRFKDYRRDGRAARLSPAVSLLRRPHDRHRNLHALHPAPGATWAAAISRENDVVTRHGTIDLQIVALLRSAIPLRPRPQKLCGAPLIGADKAQLLVCGLCTLASPPDLSA
jgi:hypothetical protein